jgi:hypothetical protein
MPLFLVPAQHSISHTVVEDGDLTPAKPHSSPAKNHEYDLEGNADREVALISASLKLFYLDSEKFTSANTQVVANDPSRFLILGNLPGSSTATAVDLATDVNKTQQPPTPNQPS